MNSEDWQIDQPLSPRKRAVREHYDQLASTRDRWVERNAYFHTEDRRASRFLVPEGLRVLDLGCGTGRLLASLKPSFGVGIDLSPEMVETARNNYPKDTNGNLRFLVGDIEDDVTWSGVDAPFDVIIMSDTIGVLEDVEATLARLQKICTRDTRVIIAYYTWVWVPILALSERFGLKMRHVPHNRLRTEDIEALLELSDFEVIKRDWRQLLPKRAFGLGPLINRTIATVPVFRRLCVRQYVIARSRLRVGLERPSTTIVVPCRNEYGNVEAAISRLPRFCHDMEIIFAEGHSTDGTAEEVRRVIEQYPELDIKLMIQQGKGKADAVQMAFAAARGDVLMIMDGDLTVPPETMPKFYNALVSGKGEFINGTRLVYPMERGAMRFLNLLGNYFFSAVFTWLLNQRLTDSLCGTKVLTRAHYEEIARNRRYFGDFDPFGDFDLIFGAAKLNLKITEVPIRYAERTYGTTQISRFSHGLLLIRMVAVAFRKLKAY